jgi:hypothetical protein
VTTERFEEEARRLLGGSFYKIKPYIRIVNSHEIGKLYGLPEVTQKEEKVKL